VATAKIVMVRSVCCESYKACGRQCSVCPNRAENQLALREARTQSTEVSGCDTCTRARVSALLRIQLSCEQSPSLELEPVASLVG